jgi:hypothetical protein
MQYRSHYPISTKKGIDTARDTTINISQGDNKMLRLSYKGGETVSRGNYWNFSTGERLSLESDGMLPGTRYVTYYKVGPVVVVAMGPFLGLLYAAFLPFIGIAIVAHTVITKLFTLGVDHLFRISAFNWTPAAVYLAGSHSASRNRSIRRTKKSP